jgi:phosphoglycolate phosphatase
MSVARFQTPKAVVFDLDGTLVDSAADIAVALNGAFRPLGVDTFSDADVMQMIGGGSMILIEKAAARAGLPLDATGKAAVTDRFMKVYHEVSAQGRGLYPGARELLALLRDSGIKLAICTNKPAPVTVTAVKALGLTGLVDFTLGATEVVPKKPAPDMLLACCGALGATPATTIMVGDSGADRGAANAAGSPCILVDFGYAKGPVAALEPDAIVSNLLDIAPLIGVLHR